MTDRVVSEHYVENTWTCTSCRAGSRGRDAVCASCGSPRDASEVAESPTIARVTDPKLIAKAEAGPNRICPYCRAQIRAAEGRCLECGADREPRTPSSATSRRSVATPAKRQPVLAIACLAVAGIGGLSSAGYWLLAPHEGRAVVTHRAWKVTRNLLAREVRHDSGWGSPLGSFNTSCERRYYSDERCEPYSCNYREESYSCRPHQCRCRTYTETQNLKNGFSKVTTRERCDTCYDSCSKTVHDTCWHRCPVYRDWCSYDYYAWRAAATETTSGIGTQPVREPRLTAADENHRVEQSEHYEIEWGDKKMDVDRATFERYELGSAWRVETTRAGGWKIINRE